MCSVGVLIQLERVRCTDESGHLLAVIWEWNIPFLLPADPVVVVVAAIDGSQQSKTRVDLLTCRTVCRWC